MSKGYCTRQNVEDFMLITIDPSFYAQVDEWISDIEAYIERQTGRVFIADSGASTRLYDGDGSNEILIDDCVAVTEIKINGGTPLVVDTDYILYPANTLPKTKIKLLTTRFHRGHQNISVKAKWGYSVAVPRDIAQAATTLVAGIINYAWELGDVQSETIGRYSVTYANVSQRDDFKKTPEILASYEKQTI